ncbi:recombinase family protein [Agromyces sp. NPDC058484]|uniref:recombinase family protein n=1 Tax=Agromyces sp. NPDC058484 TaxID=3346524 RepID=UPI00364EAB86
MTTVTYARISLDPTGKAAGVTRQLAECRELAATRGLTVTHEYVDNDVSATNRRKKRPEFQRLLADVEAGKVHTIVMWHTDRLYRLPRDLEPLIELAEDRPLRFLAVTASEIDLNTSSGRMVARILAAASASEVEHKAERQKSANRDRARRGYRTGGRRPFGYDADGMTVRPDEADAVRWGFDSLLQGASLAGIAREWNARGFITGQPRQARSGHGGQPSPWTPGAVRAVLRNGRYAGIASYLGEETGPAAWDAVVDEPTWRAAVAILENPDRRSSPAVTGRSMLSGLALCGVCEATVHAGGSARPGVRAYRCSGSSGHVSRMAEPVENFVRSVVLARVARDDAYDLLLRSSEDVAGLQMDAGILRKRLGQQTRDYADDLLTGLEYKDAQDRVKGQLAVVEAELARAGQTDVLAALVLSDDPGKVWEQEMTVETRRTVVDALMTVKVLPPGRGVRTFREDTVDIKWKRRAGAGA